MGVLAATDRKFLKAPPGTYRVVCCDVVDKGWEINERFGGVDPKIQIRWQTEQRITAEDFASQQIPLDPEVVGKPFLLIKSYNAYLGQRANLRRDLMGWRGRDFTAEELKGFELDNIIGKECTVSVIWKDRTNGDGSYSFVASVSPKMAGTALSVGGYQREQEREDYVPPERSAFDREESDQASPDIPPHGDDDIPF